MWAYIRGVLLGLGLCLTSVLFNGCIAGPSERNGENNIQSEIDVLVKMKREKERRAWEELNLTREEKEFLKLQFVFHEKKIERGELDRTQIRYVLQYRYVKEYLKKKYPSYDFIIMNGVFQGRGDDCAEFRVVEKRDYNKFMTEYSNARYSFVVFVFGTEEKPTERAADDFYEKFFKKKYGDYVLKKLQEKDSNIIGVEMIIMESHGEEYGEDLSVEDVVSGKLPLEPAFDIYRLDDGRDYEEVKKELEHRICKELDIKGSYALYIVSDRSMVKKLQECVGKSNYYLYEGFFQNFSKAKK